MKRREIIARRGGVATARAGAFLPIVLAIFLSLDSAGMSAQTARTPPKAADPPLNTLDTLSRGVVLTEAQCRALGTAIWVAEEARQFCVRYWISTAGGQKDEALVYVHGDIGGRDG